MTIEYREVVGHSEKITTIEGVEIWCYSNVHYIMRGTKGEIYPITKAIFNETYITDEPPEDEKWLLAFCMKCKDTAINCKIAHPRYCDDAKIAYKHKAERPAHQEHYFGSPCPICGENGECFHRQFKKPAPKPVPKIKYPGPLTGYKMPMAEKPENPACFGTWSTFQATNSTRLKCLECKLELECQLKEEKNPAAEKLEKAKSFIDKVEGSRILHCRHCDYGTRRELELLIHLRKHGYSAPDQSDYWIEKTSDFQW